MLREPVGNLERADAIVITRANLAENIENLKFQISKLNPLSPIFLSENRISALRALEDFQAKSQSTQSKNILENCLAFCAIGNPGNFFDQLLQDGFTLRRENVFPDHHFYKQNDVTTLERFAKEAGAEAFLTTAKDAVKLKDLKFEIPCYVIEIEPAFVDEKGFRSLINAS